MTNFAQTNQPSQPSQLTIHASREAAQAGNPMSAGHKLIEVFKRNPTKYAAVWVPVANIPCTDGSNGEAAVPTIYRPIIDAIIIKTIKGIIDDHAFSGTYEPSWIPADKLTASAIIDAMTTSASTWLTKEEVAKGWEQSATYAGFKAKMMALDAIGRKGYLRALTTFTDDINKLSAKSVKSISPEQATIMLAKIAEPDLNTTWGEFVAMRLAKIAASEEPEAIDINGL